jgi:hypothetical protein
MPVIPATWEAEIGRIEVCIQPGQKVSKTPCQQVSLAWWLMLVFPAVQAVKCR